MTASGSIRDLAESANPQNSGFGAPDISSSSLAEFRSLISSISDHISSRNESLSTLPTLPSSEAYQHAISSLPSRLPSHGLGTTGALSFIQDEILPGCLQAQNGPRYFGFVTGGVTPAAQLTDVLLTSYDENVQVTLPGQTAATAVEARTLVLVLDLIGVERDVWKGRTVTTGATASNVLGLACARDHLYANSPHLPPGYSLSRDGPPHPSISPSGQLPHPLIRIYALHPHFSILKAAALVGLGNGSNIVQILPADPTDSEGLVFDMKILKERLEEEKKVGRGAIVVYGLGEVNTGSMGKGLEDVGKMCREYGAWLHVDAAFGGFAAAVLELRHLTSGIDLADSLTLDGHKWLNVPYDMGLFYTRRASSLPGIFAPAEAPAYLTAPESAGAAGERDPEGVRHELVPSPLYVNLENSRRFRALPLLASLMALGRVGYADIVRRNILFARAAAQFIHESPDYDLLNYSPSHDPSSSRSTLQSKGGISDTPEEISKEGIIPLNIVLFTPSSSSALHRAASKLDKDPGAFLADKINGTRHLYVTGTKWMGRGAVRLAVSNWRTGLDEGGRQGKETDLQIVLRTLGQVADKEKNAM